MSIDSKTTEAESATMDIDFRMLLQLIPEFDTHKPTQEVYRFIRSCDSAFELASKSQIKILLTYALNKITGPGSSDVHTKRFQTWPDLKCFLIQKYSHTKTLGHLQLELQSLFQKPSESITDYFHRVDMCRSKLVEKLSTETKDNTLEGRVATTEEMALNVFINGLNSDIGIMLRVHTISNLTDAGNLAIQEEKIRNMNNARQILYKKSVPNPTNNFRTDNSMRTNEIRQTQNRNSIPQQSQSHTKVCNYCKYPGHLISECRKRAYNNNLRQNLNSVQQTSQQRPAAPARVNNLNSQAAGEMGTTPETASTCYSNARTLMSSPNSNQNMDIEAEALQLGW